MDESKKGDRSNKPTPNEKWVERLGGQGAETPTGVRTYVGLIRQSPSDPNVYHLYLTLDMGSSLHIQKQDVVHLEDLPPDQSPFGSLGGSRVYVRVGAKIKSVRTATSTFEAGAADEFDLDIRLGPRATGGGGGPQTIPDTGCGQQCETIPPFTDPDVGPCKTSPVTFCGCTQQCTLDTCVCPPTAGGKTCGVNCQITRAFTCVTNCGTCKTCQTQCGTCRTNCGTCQTQCGTCHTCQTKCGGETCVACTHIFTQCNQHTCGGGCQTALC
jgi:hypothetical protein